MLRENSILITRDEYTNEYCFNSKNDLKQSSMQNVLKRVHQIKNAVRCNCDLSKELYLSVKKHGTKYFLSRYPKSEEHDSLCIFHSLINELIQVDEEVAYRHGILEEPLKGSERKSSSGFPKEQAKRNTFYMYCHDLISQANIKAFLMANKTAELNNFEANDFFKAFYVAALHTKIVGNGNVINYCKENKNTKFEYGIIQNDIFANLELLNYTDDKLCNVELNAIYYDSHNKITRFIQKEGLITYKRLKLTKKLVTNYTNVTAAPYFYIAIYINDVISRFFVMPVFFNNRNICMVDSGYERNYAESLFEQNTIFLKPISNDEIDSIYPYKLGIPNYFEKIPHIIYKSDFLLLQDNGIDIVEVSGYTNPDYLELLNKKKRYYQQLHEKYFFMKFTIIDGATLRITEQCVVTWDGEEIINSGTNKGIAWKDVRENQLFWYLKNLLGTHEFIACAEKEICRRKLT